MTGPLVGSYEVQERTTLRICRDKPASLSQAQVRHQGWDSLDFWAMGGEISPSGILLFTSGPFGRCFNSMDSVL